MLTVLEMPNPLIKVLRNFFRLRFLELLAYEMTAALWFFYAFHEKGKKYITANKRTTGNAST